MRFNVIGHITSEIGLGMMVCDLIQALSDLGHEVAGYDVDPGLNRKGRNLTYQRFIRRDSEMFKDGVDISLFPISAIDHWGKAYQFGNKRVAIPLWELPDVNPAWLEPLRKFDLVVAPSDFIFETLKEAGLDVVSGGHPHYVSGAPTADRAKFGLPENKVIFTFAFDPSSDLQRKNPMAIVSAFRLARTTNAELVIQINASADQKPAFDRWLRTVIGQPNVRIMREHLSHADEMQLIASSDVYISLHRAEGLGLGMLEAMLLGKPVIATDWSGNMSFMDSSSAALVTHRLIPAVGDIPAYNTNVVGKATVWAEPNKTEAATWIKQLAIDEGLRLDLGRRGKQKADMYQTEARRMAWADLLYKEIAKGAASSAPTDKRVLIFTPIINGLMPEVEEAVKKQQGTFDWVLGRENPHPAPDNRNVTAQYQKAWQMALEGGFEALLTIEHDIRIPPDAIEHLMATDADVVYGVYQFRTWPALNAWQWINKKNLGMSLHNYPAQLAKARTDGQIRVSGIGFGCTLIRRNVLQATIPRDDLNGHACDIPFAEDCVHADFKQVARFDVLCSHWNGRKWLTPFEKEEQIKCMAVETVNAIANGRFVKLKAGIDILLTVAEAQDLQRAGLIEVRA